jgi:hypothetical protein
MARFYGTLTGQAKTSAKRRGSPNSGVTAHVRGRNIGVRVEVYADNGADVIRVYRTGGSNQPGSGELLAEVRKG